MEWEDMKRCKSITRSVATHKVMSLFCLTVLTVLMLLILVKMWLLKHAAKVIKIREYINLDFKMILKRWCVYSK